MTMQAHVFLVLCFLGSLVLYASTAVVPEQLLTECNERADCGRGRSCRRFCCVSNTRPIGRRKRSLTDTYLGTCQLMGRRGDSCLVNNQDKNITERFFVSCPCARHLDCIPNGLVDIPLGPTGICG